MRINRKLNIVFPIDTEAGTVYVHSTPISREVFEKYFLVIAKTFSAIYREGLEVMSGPRVAAMMLKRVATSMNEWDGADGVENGLIAEMHRLSNFVMPSDSGWTTIPFQDALNRKLLDPDDLSEAEGVLCFFTLAASMHRPADLTAVLNGMTSLWGAQTTSLNCTEYARSLPISTVTDSSGETETTLLVPQ